MFYRGLRKRLFEKRYSMKRRQIYAFASNKSTLNVWQFQMKLKSMNGSLCYTRGTGLILGAEKGRERGVWNMVSITVNFSLQQVNKLINGHQTFEPRKTRRLNQFYATFALVRSFSHALIMQNQKKKPIGTCSTWSPCKEKGHGTLSIFLNTCRPMQGPVSGKSR